MYSYNHKPKRFKDIAEKHVFNKYKTSKTAFFDTDQKYVNFKFEQRN